MSALFVVFGAGLFAGAGSWLWAVQSPNLAGLDRTEVFIKSLVLGSIVQTIVWLGWVYVVHWLLAALYKFRVEFAELMRTMGYAFCPAALSVFVGIAPLAVPFGVFSLGMTLLLTSIAVQTVTEGDPREAMVSTIVGFGAFLIAMGAFANVAEVGAFGGIAPGILFFSLDF
jgi:hypothetical protein